MQLTEKTSAQDYIDLEQQYGAHNYHPLDVVTQQPDASWMASVT